MVTKVTINNIELEVDVEGDFDKKGNFTVEGNDYAEAVQAANDLVKSVERKFGKGSVRVKKFPFENIINNPFFDSKKQ